MIEASTIEIVLVVMVIFAVGFACGYLWKW
jgi:hypothetical protein